MVLVVMVLHALWHVMVLHAQTCIVFYRRLTFVLTSPKRNTPDEGINTEILKTCQAKHKGDQQFLTTSTVLIFYFQLYVICGDVCTY